MAFLVLSGDRIFSERLTKITCSPDMLYESCTDNLSFPPGVEHLFDSKMIMS